MEADFVHKFAHDGNAITAGVHILGASLRFRRLISAKIKVLAVVVDFDDELIFIRLNREPDFGIAILHVPFLTGGIGVFDDVGASFIHGHFNLGHVFFGKADLQRQIRDELPDMRQISHIAGHGDIERAVRTLDFDWTEIFHILAFAKTVQCRCFIVMNLQHFGEPEEFDDFENPVRHVEQLEVAALLASEFGKTN